jgi:hypothetical protein
MVEPRCFSDVCARCKYKLCNSFSSVKLIHISPDVRMYGKVQWFTNTVEPCAGFLLISTDLSRGPRLQATIGVAR